MWYDTIIDPRTRDGDCLNFYLSINPNRAVFVPGAYFVNIFRKM